MNTKKEQKLSATETSDNKTYHRYGNTEGETSKDAKRRKAQRMHPLNYWCGPHTVFHLHLQEQ
ncbi:MAG: hypothetical protein QM731_03820 [Chitinophagaceae bacterium]